LIVDESWYKQYLQDYKTGCTVGMLNDIGLFDFGDVAKAEALIEEIGKGSPLGRILGR
jgi:aldehyde:ferredoxin oxidoreductase